jgi:hypothetical protein
MGGRLMPTLNDELAIEQYQELAPPKSEDGMYRPNRDLRFYPGGNLSAERRQALDDQAVEPEDLTTDDIIYCLSNLVTKTMYELVAQIEERWGKDAAAEVVFEWARKRAREAIKKWAHVRGIERLSADTWAQYQDLRHCMSGPVHAHSFVSILDSDGNDEFVQMDRTGCFFHTGRPEGMDSYSPYVSQGMELGYREAFPEFTFRIVRCMGEGTSSNGCTLLFRIRKSGNAKPEKVSSR